MAKRDVIEAQVRENIGNAQERQKKDSDIDLEEQDDDYFPSAQSKVTSSINEGSFHLFDVSLKEMFSLQVPHMTVEMKLKYWKKTFQLVQYLQNAVAKRFANLAYMNSISTIFIKDNDLQLNKQ
ncbi:unnamed protein product [Mytilus edulis]|nr:unnamed protein product [Mytilus edulis]